MRQQGFPIAQCVRPAEAERKKEEKERERGGESLVCNCRGRCGGCGLYRSREIDFERKIGFGLRVD